jgi:hypothetical protein
MTITYIVDEIKSDDKQVKVTYCDPEGLTHERSINIPRTESGEVDEEYFEQILEGQLRGVTNKLRIGAISFTDPAQIDQAQSVETPPEA